MALHTAKGMVGMEEGLLPHRRIFDELGGDGELVTPPIPSTRSVGSASKASRERRSCCTSPARRNDGLWLSRQEPAIALPRDIPKRLIEVLPVPVTQRPLAKNTVDHCLRHRKALVGDTLIPSCGIEVAVASGHQPT